jgi:DNA-binding CsgD family transcriptional regulator
MMSNNRPIGSGYGRSRPRPELQLPVPPSPLNIWQAIWEVSTADGSYSERLEKAANFDHRLQKYLDELRESMEVDACVLGQVVEDPIDPHVIGIKESLIPGLATRLVRHEIDREILPLAIVNVNLCMKYRLMHDKCITIHDLEALRSSEELKPLLKLDYPWPERGCMATSLSFNNKVQGVLVVSCLAPRTWEPQDCTELQEAALELSAMMILESDRWVGEEAVLNSRLNEAELADKLTSEHLVVLHAVERGLSNKEIAKEAGLSSRRVKYRIDQMLAWTGSENRTALARFARRQRLLEQ